MTLSKNQRREIRQLMYTASYYLRSASPAKKERTCKLGETAFAFEQGAVPDRSVRHLVLLGAHLSTTAIRLATVEKVLNKAGIPTPAYKACKAYFYYRGKKAPRDSRFPICASSLHILLRDSIGHEEPPETDSDERVKRWAERERQIRRLTFADAYNTLAQIDHTLRACLQAEHGIELLAASVRP